MITNETRGDVERNEVLVYRERISIKALPIDPRCVLGLYSVVLFYSIHEDEKEKERNTKVVPSTFSRLKLAQS